MGRYHPITQSFYPEYSEPNKFWKDQLDSIVRKFLSEKAEELTKELTFKVRDGAYVRDILGLSEEPEKKCSTLTHPFCGCLATPKPSESGEKWCECVVPDRMLNYWKYCPACAAPRPNVKTRREKIDAVLLAVADSIDMSRDVLAERIEASLGPDA